MKVTDILQYHQTYNQIYLCKQLLIKCDYGSQHVTNTVLYQYTQGSLQNVNKITPMSHKNKRSSINIAFERMEWLGMTQKPGLSDFYSDKSISFNAKLTSNSHLGSFASDVYQVVYCQLQADCARLDRF